MKLTKIFGIVLSLHVGVILLVMFQPGCQTGGKKDNTNVSVEDNGSVISKSFNRGINNDKGSTDTPSLSNELREPTRPITGELFVPVENEKVEDIPLPTVNKPRTKSVNEINLVPDNLSVYVIAKGDTLWGIARKHNLTLIDLLSSNPGLTKNSRLKIGQEIMILKSQKSDLGGNIQSSEPPVTMPFGSTTYVVQAGDSLTKIARIHGISLSSLMIANNMGGGTIIKLGQVLTIPAAEENRLGLKNEFKEISAGSNTHKVKKGENLSRIAAQYGVTVKEIMEWNNIINASKIQIGQVIKVSNSSTTPSVGEKLSPTIEAVKPEEDSKVEDFFKGVVEERPIIDVPEQ
jgi:LysM repeat protein